MWTIAKQILPFLLISVFADGFLLGRQENEGIIPNRWIHSAVGGSSFRANLIASIVGALKYFTTLTEVPILQGLLGSGMGKGPVLALLLSGSALSLPSMMVMYSFLGWKKRLPTFFCSNTGYDSRFVFLMVGRVIIEVCFIR